MPIDKIIPRFLVSDKDERLLKEGAMTDALNVSVSEDGDGTYGVIKNIKGTAGVIAENGSAITIGETLTGIGSVTDDIDGFIYFFVADTDNDGNGEDAIYRVDTSDDTHELVFSHATFLAFDKNNPIKADLIKRDFADTGSTQTVIYFTDGVNPPRKINVDRAIAGDYNSLSTAGLEYALNSVKAAPTAPVSFRFSTDSTALSNNFYNDSFQIATQLIYKDGEESAISPYSKLATSRSALYQGLTTSATETNKENVLDITLNWSPDSTNPLYVSDVAKVRLLARVGNTGAFFKIDEFDPTVSLSKNVYGSDVNVFTPSSRVYKWYNEGVYAGVSTTLVDKMFDSVPFKAEGQCIAGNRLFYSNYVEGRDNVDTDVTLTVNYSAPPNDSTASYGGTANQTIEEGAGANEGTDNNGDIFLDFVGGGFTWPSPDNATAIVPAGTTTQIRFDYHPEGFFHHSDNVLNLLCKAETNTTTNVQQFFSIKVGTDSPDGNHIDLPDADINVDVSVTNEEDVTVADLALLFKEAFEQTTVQKTYTVASGFQTSTVFDAAGTSVFSNGNSIVFPSTDVTVTYSFDDIVDSNVNDAQFAIKPYISDISIAPTSPVTGASYSDFFQVSGGGSQLFRIYQATMTTSDEQSDFTYNVTNTTAFLNDEFTDSNATGALRSFKAGSTHELGIVYFDKFNRSGFVNKLGSFYSKHFSERTGGQEGMTSVTIHFDHTAPSWASRYQIVYPGASTYSDFTTYTTGGGYAPFKEGTNTYETNSKRVYVSLQTLTKYQSEKGALKSYSFTAGDKLRVISYDGANSTTPSIVFPKSNNNTPIEFNVVGVDVLSTASNPLVGGTGNEINDGKKGTFLILEAPAIESNHLVDDDSGGTANDSLKYAGFDWNSITNTAYGDGDSSSNTNFWGRNCLVEIISPRPTASTNVYYEIGESRKVGTYKDASLTNHGPDITINEGDVHWRQSSASTPFYQDLTDDSTANPNWSDSVNDPDTWRFETKWMENKSVHDFTTDESWSRGRPHLPFERAAERRIENGITYSDAYAENVENLSLSSFNASLSNFSSVQGSFGPLRFIGNYNDDIVAIQQNKLSLLPVNKNILEYAGGAANVTVSTNVLGKPRYSAGDYGCGSHPESVLIRDGSVYFTDDSRDAVVALTGNQLVPISEKNMSSFFEDFFGVAAVKYVSGYYPNDNTYYLTRLTSDGTNQETVGYDVARGVWLSRYSFHGDVYATVNNDMYSAKYVEIGGVAFPFHKHNELSNYNKFYNTTAASEVQVVSKMSPSRVKVFNALSYEGSDGDWEVSGSSDITTSLGQTAGPITSWTEKEGNYYASMPRHNGSTGNYGTNKRDVYVGNFTNPSNDNQTFLVTNARIDRLPILFDGSLTLFVDATSTEKSISVASFSAGTNGFTVVLDSAVTGISGNCFVRVTETQSKTTEDVIRGNFSTIKMTLPSASAGTLHELYCINTHITDSKVHHPLGR